MTPIGISVCMATYNGERFIEAQLDSILRQLGPVDEVVVSDDGSGDRTLQKVRSFADPRVRIVESAARRGVTPNFENALAHAGGEMIFLADQDDLWLPDKVAASREALQAHRLVLSDCRVIDEKGRLLHGSYFELIGSAPGALRNFLRNSYLGCCMAFRRELLALALPIPAAVAHDYWIGMLEELTGEPYFLRRVLLEYRRHGRATSSAAGKSDRPLAARLTSRAALGWQLASRCLKRRASTGPI